MSTSKSFSYHLLHLFVKEEFSDAMQGILYDEGCVGLEEKEGKSGSELAAYFVKRGPCTELVRKIRSKAPATVVIRAETLRTNSVRFRARPFPPIRLVKNIWIVPPRELRLKGMSRPTRFLIIRPGMAFGTGRHETTKLAAGLLVDLKPEGKSVLDVGTGSGVLALLAKFLDARRVDTVEVDPIALENARENRTLNHSSIHFYSSLTEVRSKHDIVMANITTDTILKLSRQIDSSLLPGGFAVLSGILYHEASQIERRFSRYRLLKKKRMKEWVGFLFQKPLGG